MKHFYWILTLTLALCFLWRPASAATAPGSVPPELAGFTPQLSLSIVLREPYSLKGESTMSATVTLDGPDKDKKDYAVTVSGPADTNVKFTLTLGGEAGSNSKNITVNLPPDLGTATYTATLDDSPDVNSSDSTEIFEFEVKVTKSEADPNPAQLDKPVRVDLEAELKAPAGVEIPDKVTWKWNPGEMFYRETADDEWGDAVADGPVLFSELENSVAFFNCQFGVAGRYKIEVVATASFEYNGKTISAVGRNYIQ